MSDSIFFSSDSSSSPSTSSDSSPSPPVKCLICSMTARGNHFGVISCRACAAFFRRSWVQKKEYKCRQKNGKCDVNGNERYQCRACRLKKCKELGMTPENVQMEKGFPSSPDGPFPSNGSYSLAMNKVPFASMYPSLQKPKILIDVSPTINRLKIVLSSSSPPMISPQYFEMNTLERMRFGLWNYRSERKFGDLKFNKKIVVEVPNKTWENDLVRIATWLLHSEHYRSLSLEEKMSIFKKISHRWRKFEKWMISVDTFGQRVYKDKIIICGDYNAASLDSIELDYSNISDRPNEEMDKLFSHQHGRMLREVAKPLADIQPSTIEMTYMLCQLVFNSLETQLTGYSAQIGESFLNEISENLHSYYINKKIYNYAWRLQKLMKIVNSVKEIEREREEMMKLCALFDVFKIRLTDEEMFIC